MSKNEREADARIRDLCVRLIDAKGLDFEVAVSQLAEAIDVLNGEKKSKRDV